MARARATPGLAPDDSYGSAAAKVVGVRAEELFERGEAVLDMGNIEALHAMRVTTRRLRAALEVFEPCFAPRAYARAIGDLKALADALGGRRDRDVQIEALERYARARPKSERDAVLTFVERLRQEQAAANEAVERALADAERHDLRGRLDRLVQKAR